MYPKDRMWRFSRSRAGAVVCSAFILLAFNAIVVKAVAESRHMFLVAHEDDDLLFMNPDLFEAIDSDFEVRTVYLTAGDAGKGEAYWRGREEGIKSAYAHMAQVANQWTEVSLPIAGINLHCFYLDASNVSVVFMRVPDASSGSPTNLEWLWNEEVSGGHIETVDNSNSFTKADLVVVLAWLMADFSAFDIHLQDRTAYHGTLNYDHVDHRYTGEFTSAALEVYQSSYPVSSIKRYRAYNINFDVANLDPDDPNDPLDKLDIFRIYALHDSEICGNGSDLTCLEQPTNPYAQWCQRQYEADDDITSPGDWTGSPSAVSWGFGRIDIVVKGEDEAVYHKAYVGNNRWHAWESLGGTVGSSPIVTSWGVGRLDVFVRGQDTQLYYKTFDAQQWSNWQVIPSSFFGTPAAVSWGTGRIDVAVRGTDNQIYHIAYAGGSWQNWELLPNLLATGSPVITSKSEETFDLFVHGQDGRLHRQSYAEGQWSGWLIESDDLAVDTFVASSWPGQTKSFSFDSEGHLNFYNTVSQPNQWSPVFNACDPTTVSYPHCDPTLTHLPTLATWGAGRFDVFARGADNRLYYKVNNDGNWGSWEAFGWY